MNLTDTLKDIMQVTSSKPRWRISSTMGMTCLWSQFSNTLTCSRKPSAQTQTRSTGIQAIQKLNWHCFVCTKGQVIVNIENSRNILLKSEAIRQAKMENIITMLRRREGESVRMRDLHPGQLTALIGECEGMRLEIILIPFQVYASS